MTTRPLLLIAFLLLIGACGDNGGPTGTPGKDANPANNNGKPAGSAYADSAEGLKSYMSDLSAAALADDSAKATPLAEGLIFKDADGWFKTTFGDDKAAALSKEYAGVTKSGAAGLIGMFKVQKAKNRTEFIVERFENASDPAAVGYQQTAMEAAKTPLVVHSVRIVEPGKTSGQHLYNFVYIDGKWRFVGPMKSIKPPGSAELDAVAGLRGRDREEFFKSGKLPD